MKILFQLLFTLSIPFGASILQITATLAQQSFTETMGTYFIPVNNAYSIADYENANNFDLDWLTYSGSALVQSSEPSVGYTDASGGNNIYLRYEISSSGTQAFFNKDFIVRGITPSVSCNNANTMVSFGLKGTVSSFNRFQVFYSIDDGANWVFVQNMPQSSTWGKYSISVPGNANALRFYVNNDFDYSCISCNVYRWYLDDITIRNDATGCALPVSLTEFSAALTPQKQVSLSWQTAWERNADYFSVERSADLVHFEPIARVQASGNATSLYNYALTDEIPLRGLSYYRLNQVDLDGTSHVYPAVSIRTDGTDALYPNPSNGTYVNLDVAATSAIELFSLTGKSIPFTRKKVSESRTQLLPNEALAPGIYLIRINGITRKWVVQ